MPLLFNSWRHLSFYRSWSLFQMETQRGAFSRLGAVKQKTITAYTERKKNKQTKQRIKTEQQTNKQTIKFTSLANFISTKNTLDPYFATLINQSINLFIYCFYFAPWWKTSVENKVQSPVKNSSHYAKEIFGLTLSENRKKWHSDLVLDYICVSFACFIVSFVFPYVSFCFHVAVSSIPFFPVFCSARRSVNAFWILRHVCEECGRVSLIIHNTIIIRS